MIDVNPTSQRWKEICEITKEIKGIKKSALFMKFIQDAIKRARKDEWSKCNSDWGGMQEGF